MSGNFILPFSYTSTYLIYSIQIIIEKLVLHKSVSIVALCYDENETFLFEKRFTFEGEEYFQWGTDDDYLLNLTISKMQAE